jgi:hypothetical protein
MRSLILFLRLAEAGRSQDAVRVLRPFVSAGTEQHLCLPRVGVAAYLASLCRTYEDVSFSAI